MEPQLPFDRERALLVWREELSAQPGVSADNVRELQSHLLQCFDELKRRGLSDEDAFVNARRRLGSAREVGMEFARANPARIWRERVFWMAFSGLLLWGWTGLVRPVGSFLHLSWPAFGALCYAPPLLFVMGIALGWISPRVPRPVQVFNSRFRFAIGAVGLMIAVSVIYGLCFRTELAVSVRVVDVLAVIFSQLGWPVTFACLAVWLLPNSVSAASAVSAPVHVWRERVFWMAMGHLLMLFWWNVHLAASQAFPAQDVGSAAAHFGWRNLIWFLSSMLPPMLAGVYTARKGFNIDGLFSARWRAPAILIVLFVSSVGLNGFVHYSADRRFNHPPEIASYLLSLFVNGTWPAAIAAIGAWLAPVRKKNRDLVSD